LCATVNWHQDLIKFFSGGNGELAAEMNVLWSL
jgi:hypothetical protein